LKVQIVNVIATIKLNRTFDLADLHVKIPESTYDPWSFAGLFIPTERGRVKLCLFNAGHVKILGAKNQIDIDFARKRLFEIFRDLGISVEQREPTIRNIVASITLDRELRFEEFVRETKALYDQETFPGATVRFQGCTFQVFSNGRVTCLGCKSFEQLRSVTESFERFIRRWYVE